MGAWGPGIFANDTAADVRGQWRAALLAGTDAAAASAALTEGWEDGVADDPTATEFWTGLAAAQHETGHLQPDVRDRALALIEAGGDAELYEDAAPARLRALRGLADKLTGPQPKPKKLRGPRAGPDPGVEVGDVVRIWSSDRSVSVLYAVTRMHEHERKRWPELLGLYWEGGDLPSRDELERLPYMSMVDLGAVGRAGLPPSDLFGWAAPYEMTILVNRPGEELRPETGEVVATGVRRDPPFPESGTAATWATIVATLDHGALPLMLEATRRRLARYGPDLRAWERARREHASSPRAVAFAERVAQIRASDADAGRQRQRIFEMLGTPPGEDDGGHGDESA